MASLEHVLRRDTGVGPTGPGRWWAWDRDSVVGLTAFHVPEGGAVVGVVGPIQHPAGALVWRWDDLPEVIEGRWTRGWPCAPAEAAS